jgi:hypothetical protein
MSYCRIGEGQVIHGAPDCCRPRFSSNQLGIVLKWVSLPITPSELSGRIMLYLKLYSFRVTFPKVTWCAQLVYDNVDSEMQQVVY